MYKKIIDEEIIVYYPVKYYDNRGYFMETYKESNYDEKYVQDNQSISTKNVIRGLHFQYNPPMGKLMRVSSGRAYLVSVNVKTGKWFGIEASEESGIQVYAPAHYARGFCSLDYDTVVQYKCTAEYNEEGEAGFMYNDEDINVIWPVDNPIVSVKDNNQPSYEEVKKRNLF